MFVCCECCVLSGRGLCDELIIRPEEPYRVWCVVVCDLENEEDLSHWGKGVVASKTNKQTSVLYFFILMWFKPLLYMSL